LPRRTLLASFIGLLLLLAMTPVGAQAQGMPTNPLAASAGQPLASAPVAVDPLDDPWLSEEGPAIARPVEVAEEQSRASWVAAKPSAFARAAALRRTRLELGLGDLPAPAILIAAAATEEEPEVYSELARQVAPGVPAFQIDHAVALWNSGDIGAALLAVSRAGLTVARSLPAQLWLLENLSFALLIVVLAAPLGFILLAALHVYSHAAHDLGDLLSNHMPTFARYALLGGLLLVPLVLGEGLFGLALALFAVAFIYGGTGQRNTLVMAAVLLVIGIHPLAQLSSVAANLIDSDPVASSVLQVLDGTETAADVERLEAAAPEDLAAIHALAYRDRRFGLVESSRVRLEEVISRVSNDVVALANLGNIEKRRGNTDAAIGYYERAAVQESDATLLFSLSQAYASAFRMEEYEATLIRAQKVDDEAVAGLSSLDDAALVADLRFPVSHLIRDRLVSLALSQDVDRGAVAILAPGRLGAAWHVTGGAFALIVLCSLLLSKSWSHASLCTRCGHRICERCEETVWSEEICEDCHHLFQYPEATDPSLRMARLQALSEREVRFDRVWLALSLMVPGMAGFSSRRPDLAMFGLLLFAWTVTWFSWPTGIFEDPFLMGSAAILFFAIPGALAAMAYASVVVLSLIVRKNS